MSHLTINTNLLTYIYNTIPLLHLSAVGLVGEGRWFPSSGTTSPVWGVETDWTPTNRTNSETISLRDYIKPTWINNVNVAIDGPTNNLTKTAGGDGWGAGVVGAYSGGEECISGNCTVQWIASQTDKTTTVALDFGTAVYDVTSPDLAYAMHLGTGGSGSIWEFGVQIGGSAFTYQVGDLLEIAIVGANVWYLKNGVALLQHVATALEYPLFIVGIIYHQGGTIQTLRWFPGPDQGYEETRTIEIQGSLGTIVELQWGYDRTLDDDTHISLSEDDIPVFSIKSNPKNTWSLSFPERETVEAEIIEAFWMWHRKTKFWWLINEGRNRIDYVRFDSGLKIIDQNEATHTITCIVTQNKAW